MKNDIVMPQMGESITNGTITKWHKQPGDKIEIDEILLEISTDKVESEIPSPMEGRIEEVKFPEGETVEPGALIGYIDTSVSAEAGSAEASSSVAAPAVASGGAVSSPAAPRPTRKNRWTIPLRVAWGRSRL